MSQKKKQTIHELMETAFMDDGIERVEPIKRDEISEEKISKVFNPFEVVGDKHKPIFNIQEEIKQKHRFKHKEYISKNPSDLRKEEITTTNIIFF